MKPANSAGGNLKIKADHEAELLTLKVKDNRTKTFVALNDLPTDNGTVSLLDFFHEVLLNLKIDNEQEVLEAQITDLNNEYLEMIFSYGTKGVVGKIYDEDSEVKIRLEKGDSTRVICGAVAKITRGESVGLLAIHKNSDRYPKNLLKETLSAEFKRAFQNHTLELNSFVDQRVMTELLKRPMKKLVFKKYVAEGDQGQKNIGGTWVARGESYSIRTEITKNRLSNAKDRVLNYLNAEGDDTFYEFQGIQYDEIDVVLDIGDGRQKTCSISEPYAELKVKVSLENVTDNDGEPENKLLIDALKNSIHEALN